MQDKIIKLILFACALKLGDAGLDFSLLPESTKQEIVDVIAGKPLIDNGIAKDTVHPDDVKFYLWATKSAENYTLIDHSNPSELNKNDVTIIFIIHGWLENRETPWYEPLRNAFFQQNEQSYIIEVDWSQNAAQDYIVSAYDTKRVGDVIGKFIADVHKKYSVPLENFLIVGHSLGGQVAGFVGKKVQDVTNNKLSKIITLDPAGPVFEQRGPNDRLSPTDAIEVFVVHTNGGTFGYKETCGTIDFFPNGGENQPGCPKENISSTSDLNSGIFCAHWRSWEYFIEALPAPQSFQASKCKPDVEGSNKDDLCNINESLGNYETTQTGNFCLTTNSESPYSK